jgi:hypothetical protein
VWGGFTTNHAIDGSIRFFGQSRWYIIETMESYNGQRQQVVPQGSFLKWYASNAFGGTNYSNTPVAAVSHVEEPNLSEVNDAAVYFGLWFGNRTFATAAWQSRRTIYLQAVGDPLVTK